MKKIKLKNNQSITAIILTFNEEIHIERCIKSIVNIVDNIIVIDSFSTDQTLKICKNFKNVKIYKRKFINQANQINWALKNLTINSNWILRIDADEYLTKYSRKFFKKKLIKNNNSDGIILTRKISFLNKIINYGSTSPHKSLRIWKNKRGKYDNSQVDEQVIVKGKISETDLVLIDDNLKGLYFWTIKHINYASREAYEYFRNSKKVKINKDPSKENKKYKFQIYYKLPLIIRPFLFFMYSYFYKLGFFAGVRGFLYYLIQTLLYRLLVDFFIIKRMIFR